MKCCSTLNINDKNNSQTLKWHEMQTKIGEKKNHFEFSLESFAFKNFAHAIIFIFIRVILVMIACAFTASQLFIIFHLKSKRALFTVQLFIRCVFNCFFIQWFGFHSLNSVRLVSSSASTLTNLTNIIANILKQNIDKIMFFFYFFSSWQ